MPWRRAGTHLACLGVLPRVQVIINTSEEVCPTLSGAIGAALGYLGIIELAATLVFVSLFVGIGIAKPRNENASIFNMLKGAGMAEFEEKLEKVRLKEQEAAKAEAEAPKAAASAESVQLTQDVGVLAAQQAAVAMPCAEIVDASAAMEVEATGLSAEASAHIDATHKSLSKGRKKRAMPAGYPDAAALSNFDGHRAADNITTGEVFGGGRISLHEALAF